jgi:hypothetical protein
MFGICYGITHVTILFTPEQLNLQCKRHNIVEKIQSQPTSHGEEKDINGDTQDKNGQKYQPASREENPNEKGAEWYLKEGQTVAIVERNVPSQDGKEKSTAF